MYKNMLWKKSLVVGIIILLIGVSIIPSTAINVRVNKSSIMLLDGNTLYVGGSGPGNYSNIQDAIDNASDGDTVFVYNGMYYLNETIIINKSIRLFGENKFNTILYGMGILINTSNVEISGFTLQNGIGIILMPFFEEPNNNTISGNIFKSEEYILGLGGVYIFNVNYSYCTVSDNSFFNCGLIITSYPNYVNNNTVNGKPLVYFEGASDEVISDAGQVIIVGCNNITVENLELNNIMFGIQLIDSKYCLISNNKLFNNGIVGFFYNSSNNIISGNIILNNVIGLIFGTCGDNKISGNSFENNGNSLFFITSSCNLISYNNFKYIYKSLNHNILSTKSDNEWIGNFWNRAILFPVIIWNFKITNFRYFPILPTSPDFDWRPSNKPYNIPDDGISSYEKKLNSYQSTNLLLFRFLAQSSILNLLLQRFRCMF